MARHRTNLGCFPIVQSDRPKTIGSRQFYRKIQGLAYFFVSSRTLANRSGRSARTSSENTCGSDRTERTNRKLFKKIVLQHRVFDKNGFSKGEIPRTEGKGVGRCAVLNKPFDALSK